jgi:integrase
MAGRRPLTILEERKLLRVLRRTPARNAALITAQLMTGFRISEILSVTVGHVWRDGAVLTRLGIAPRKMKGGHGRTRWVPILPTLRRALERHLHCLARRYELTPDLPLFLSRQSEPDGSARALSRESAHRIVHAAFRRAGLVNDGRLGTHSLRKSWVRATYLACDRDIHLLRAALQHSSIAVTERYLEVDAGRLERAMRAIDRSRAPRRRREADVIPLPTGQVALATTA